ncbi:hypothetical protein E2562_037120 [Oryza meyeriana var. granulata]|uniref:Uncharacterized protein n=1 Tax=Oryza meyeriana var. granulata TaxID=110450 RepID=A0A6G1CBC3_9ORYZ|nr:hypothetical protein E2562_037120 [Oryza meyeriana var. granulata]
MEQGRELTESDTGREAHRLQAGLVETMLTTALDVSSRAVALLARWRRGAGQQKTAALGKARWHGWAGGGGQMQRWQRSLRAEGGGAALARWRGGVVG